MQADVHKYNRINLCANDFKQQQNVVKIQMPKLSGKLGVCYTLLAHLESAYSLNDEVQKFRETFWLFYDNKLAKLLICYQGCHFICCLAAWECQCHDVNFFLANTPNHINTLHEERSLLTDW